MTSAPLAEAAAGTSPEPAHERVHRALRRRILHGELAPGQPVTLRGLAAALGVSMTPAREAVRRLTAERALETTPTGRVLAPVKSAEALAELLAARALLEPELAARAAARADAALVARLRSHDDAVEAALAAGDAATYVRANTAFHATLYAAARAPALMALVESVWLQLNPSMRILNGRAGTAGLADHHEQAMAACARRDGTAAAAAVLADIRQAEALIAGGG
ncbi:MAG: GntR family transcriptional regulator [Rhodobacteraceae bacterium]|nr:MAG: GntR family transcriptional regulator [Paracoccaceae bacterium]